VNIAGADWLPYRLNLNRPWQTSRGCITERVGRLIRLRATDGRIGWGDCAPLPDFGIDEAAATSFAEECAMLDLAAQQAGLPLDAWLSGNEPVASISINANLGSINTANEETFRPILAAGYRVLKLKVGMAPWQDEIDRLRQLSLHLPADASFRLDANTAWNMDDALRFLAASNDLPIESLEEPLHQPSAHTLSALQERAPYPLAIDESCHLIDSSFFNYPPVRRVVLKPARQGGLLRTMETGLRARAAGIGVIVTSSLESSCGLLACALLAAAIAPGATHGLATGEWLSSDTGKPPSLRNGQLVLPGIAGIGFVPTEA